MDRKVIIAYDGSPNSKDALELGEELCDVLDATPLIASCVIFPTYLMDQPELGLAVEEDTKPLFEAAEYRLSPRRIETRSVFDESPARALQNLAEDVEPLAIVIGSAHHGAVGRVVLGDVGSKLLGGAPCPVAVAPHKYAERDGEHLLRIGVAVDGGEESNHALGEAIALAERLHASLSIVSALGSPPIGYGTIPGAAVGDLGRMQREFTAQVLEEAADLVPANIPVKIQRLQGDPADVLAKISEGLDLMLIGSRGYGPVRRVLLGGVAARLMRNAACPVLITPRHAGEHGLGLATGTESGAIAG
jgi:nucleotide-binding universal stress UspA family protein